MRKYLAMAGAVLALASCTQQPTINPNYLDGTYSMDYWSYEDNGIFYGVDHSFTEDVCLIQFEGNKMRTLSYDSLPMAVPMIGHLYMANAEFNVTYVEGGVLIEGEFWSVAEGNAFIAREFEMGAVYQLHKMMLNEI